MGPLGFICKGRPLYKWRHFLYDTQLGYILIT